MIMEFCSKCGSLKVSGNCTNKKCDQHIKSLVELATPQQVEYIKELAEQLSEDISDLNFDNLSKSDAAYMIDEYLERLDEAEKGLDTDSALLQDSDEEEPNDDDE